jgi:hypothetical protein
MSPEEFRAITREEARSVVREEIAVAIAAREDRILNLETRRPPQ